MLSEQSKRSVMLIGALFWPRLKEPLSEGNFLDSADLSTLFYCKLQNDGELRWTNRSILFGLIEMSFSSRERPRSCLLPWRWPCLLDWLMHMTSVHDSKDR